MAWSSLTAIFRRLFSRRSTSSTSDPALPLEVGAGEDFVRFILASIWRKHRIPLSVVRRALDDVAKQMRSARPLVEMPFQTDGVDLIVNRLGTLINLTGERPTEMADVLRQHLSTSSAMQQDFLFACSRSPARMKGMGSSRRRW